MSRRPRRAATAAPFWRRLLADCVDLAVIAGAWAALWQFGLLRPTLPPPTYDWVDHVATALSVHHAALRGPAVLALAVAVLYSLVLRTLLGRTPGEALLGLRLVTREGFAAGPVHSLAHGLATVVGVALVGVGYTWAAIDPNRQGLAEYVSATRLIHGEAFPDRAV